MIASRPRRCGCTRQRVAWRIEAPSTKPWPCCSKPRNSIPIRSPSLRRLSRIYLGALGRPELAVEFGKKVLAIEPGDTDTLSRLVEFYNRRNDTAGCQSVLKEVLANPKLDAHSPGRLLAQFELGKLYSEKLNQADNAAKAYAEVMAGLDDKAANRLSPAGPRPDPRQ